MESSIYICLDNKEQDWKKAVATDGVPINQYMLIKGMNRIALNKFLKIRQIPRYVFLTGEHKIKMAFAPKPIPSSEKEIKKMIDSIKQEHSNKNSYEKNINNSVL